MRKSDKTLILVDVQPTFMPGGSLAVSGGDEIIDPINRLIDISPCTIATQDWHPPDHKSFASQHEGKSPGDIGCVGGIDQMLWPDHAVQGTHEASIHHEVRLDKVDAIIRKGVIADIDSYSGFFDNAKKNETALNSAIKSAGAKVLYVCGLATDFCVKFTVLDALSFGYEVKLIAEACRGVNLNDGDSNNAIAEMTDAGAWTISIEDAIKELSS